MGQEIRGMMTVKDPWSVNLRGSRADIITSFIRLEFIPCLHSKDKTCATEQELDDFLANHVLNIFAASSFIEMD